ncbi:MAG: CDP-alcohol phosphatidyltransferase family protein [Candidatus Binatia bacterium]
MNIPACIVGNSSVLLWGIDGATRLERQLRAAGLDLVTRDEPAEGYDSVLLVRGDVLFDERVLRRLLQEPGILLVTAGNPSPDCVAAHVESALAARALAVLERKEAVGAAVTALPGVVIETPASLCPGHGGPLLKASPVVVLPIRPGQATALEDLLFDGSYKGVTDLVTKWVWPRPARAVTRLCAEHAVSPNAVTAASYALVVAVLVLFAQGHFAMGLVLAWIMTFLDTVDGKLARVTVTSTPAGHYLDHILDLVHPPFWYLAWGYGVEAHVVEVCTLQFVFAAIFAGYIAGRLAEGAFDALLAGFSMFSWRPVDSYFRLILARRNPNLLILTGFALAGRHREGLVAVAAWTVISAVVLVMRLAQAAWERGRGRPIPSWLEELGDDLAGIPSYARPFAADPAAARRLT